MNIDINTIINNKINEMDKNNEVQKCIEEGIQKAIISGVKEALDGYSIKRIIEDKMKEQVSQNLESLDFTSYNSFIADKIKSIVEGTCKKDLCDKIEKTFNEIFVNKRENIKLSEIIEKYRDWICENVEEYEKYDLEHFHVDFDEDASYHWITITLSKEEDNDYGYDDTKIKFTVHRKSDDEDNEKFNIGWIGSTYINNEKIDKKIKIGNLSEIEQLLINLYYNETPIIIDCNEDDIDNSFDIDI